MPKTEAELRKMIVKDLRIFAKENTSLAGLTSMKKDELIDAIMNELGIEKEKKASTLDVKDKNSQKREIHRLKEKKEALLKEESKNSTQLKNIRRRIRRLKKGLRKVS